MKSINIIIPCLKEAENLKFLIPQITDNLKKVITDFATKFAAVDKISKETLEPIVNDLIESGSCRHPTRDNPFMNPSLFNSESNDLEPCPSYNNKGIQRIIEDNFNEDLYTDVNDIFGKNNSQRQFYTIPGKSIPNNQKSFAEWLYKTPPTCKEGNGLQCIANQYSSLGEGPWNGTHPPTNS